MHPSHSILALAVIATALLPPLALADEPSITADRSSAAAAKLVESALITGLLGDSTGKHRQLLAVRDANPDFGPVRWHLGEVRSGDVWLPIAAAEVAARANKTLAPYYKQRAKLAGSVEGQARLAAWCQRNGLTEQARAHWYQVLRRQPGDKRALRALNAQWYRGVLLETNAVVPQRRRDDRLKSDLKTLGPKMKTWRRMVSDGKDADRAAAVAELRSTRSDIMVVVITAVLLKPTKDPDQTASLQTEAMEILGALESPDSLRILAWHAAMSPYQMVRDAARRELSRRPLRDAVPILLAGLAMPLDVAVTTQAQGSRTATTLSFDREGPAGRNYQNQLTSYQTIGGSQFVAIDFGTFNRVWKDRPLINNL